METILIFIGFATCFILGICAIVKALEGLTFFIEFRQEVNKSLDRIEKSLNETKP